MKDVPFIRDFYVSLNWEGPYIVVDYETCHPRARVDTAWPLYDYNVATRRNDITLVLSVRDRGNASFPEMTRQVVIVRRANDLTECPEGVGDLITVVAPRGDPFAYYVFDAKGEPRAIRNSAPETSAPARAVAQSTPADPACPCPVLGTKVHDTGTAKTGGEDELRAWFESPDSEQSSAA